MIQEQVKLRLSSTEEKTFCMWLHRLYKVWNYAVRKIKLDANDKIYYSKMKFQNILAGHSEKLEIPSCVIQGVLVDAHTAWQRCFKKIGKEPRLKGKKNPMKSFPIPVPIKPPKQGKFRLPIIGEISYLKKVLPEGPIKCARVVRKASGWWLCLFIDAQPRKIEPVGDGCVGIDPGFKTTLTLSDGEKICLKGRYDELDRRIAKAQRGGNRKLVARLRERQANIKKNEAHHISKKLVSKHSYIAFSKDNIQAIARNFGKSVAKANIYRIRQMIAYKSASMGREYVEVDSKNSTKTCSVCFHKADFGGLSGLGVREWTCEKCGAHHDRDVNAAINTLLMAKGAFPKNA